uniref:CSON006725 protein n=1 Tax=Culicoides sonorensis TaxID=179676 RepID=A0A336L9W5_CULSO
MANKSLPLPSANVNFELKVLSGSSKSLMKSFCTPMTISRLALKSMGNASITRPMNVISPSSSTYFRLTVKCKPRASFKFITVYLISVKSGGFIARPMILAGGTSSSSIFAFNTIFSREHRSIAGVSFNLISPSKKSFDRARQKSITILTSGTVILLSAIFVARIILIVSGPTGRKTHCWSLTVEWRTMIFHCLTTNSRSCSKSIEGACTHPPLLRGNLKYWANSSVSIVADMRMIFVEP